VCTEPGGIHTALDADNPPTKLIRLASYITASSRLGIEIGEPMSCSHRRY
jgi:hypothetical protein